MDAEADPDFPDEQRRDVNELATGLCADLDVAEGAAQGAVATLAGIAAALFARHMRFDSADIAWPDRDRLMLGGGAMCLGPRLAALLGAPPGLTEVFAHAPGQSLGAAMGAALAERMLAARFGRSLVDHRIWLLLDSAELGAGAAQEAAILAGQLQLGRLTVIAAAGPADWPGLARFTALGWTLRRIDADDPDAARAALSAAVRSRKPTLIACRMAAEPGQPAPESRKPGTEAGAAWEAIGHRGAGARRAWLKRLKRHACLDDFTCAASGQLPPRWQALLPPPEAAKTPTTAETVDAALARLAPAIPGIAGLPADHQAAAWGGHAQAEGAALIGMGLHGGILPLGRKPLVASEALRPAMRLAAVLGLRVVQLLTEPAQPCPAGGLRAAWRSMRNVHVFRPAGPAEAMVCLQMALRRAGGPSVLLLTEAAPADPPGQIGGSIGGSALRGGYLALTPDAPRALTLIASGPELAVALEAACVLGTEGMAAAVVSLPCWEQFALQDPSYRRAVLGDAPRLGLEAGGGFGWERHLGPDGLFVGAADGGVTVPRVVAAARILERRARVLETGRQLT